MTLFAELREFRLAAHRGPARESWAIAWATAEQRIPVGEESLAVIAADEHGGQAMVPGIPTSWSGELLLTEQRFVLIGLHDIGHIPLRDIADFGFREQRTGLFGRLAFLFLYDESRRYRTFMLRGPAQECREYADSIATLFAERPGPTFD